MGKLDGKVAVVTGGSRGLGLSIALEFIKEGAIVVVASRSQKSVDKALELLQAEGGQVGGMAMDVSNREQVQALADFAISRFGKLDIWVNNAGTAGPYGPTLGFEPEDFVKVVETNILGTYYGSTIALRYFTEQYSGKLINILGHGYNRPVPWQNAYGSSKAWSVSFTKALAQETKSSGAEVFAFNPGMILTELLTNVDVIEESEQRLKSFPTIVRMWAKPAEIPAKKVVWIASSATNGKTGLLVNIFSPWSMISGALKEGVRALLHRPAADLAIHIKTIPPYRG